MTSLKPCPFCGSEETAAESRHMPHIWEVGCRNCIAEGPSGSDEESASLLWNSRIDQGSPIVFVAEGHVQHEDFPPGTKVVRCSFAMFKAMNGGDLTSIAEPLEKIAKILPMLVAPVVIDASSVDIDDLHNIKPWSIVRCKPTSPESLASIAEALTKLANPVLEVVDQAERDDAITNLREIINAYTVDTSFAQADALAALRVLEGESP